MKSTIDNFEVERHQYKSENENLNEKLSLMSDYKEKIISHEEYVIKIKEENSTLKDNYKTLESKIDIKDKELQNNTLSQFAIQERDDKLEYMQKEIDKLEKENLNLNKLLQSREKDINERDNKIKSMEMNDK